MRGVELEQKTQGAVFVAGKKVLSCVFCHIMKVLFMNLVAYVHILQNLIYAAWLIDLKYVLLTRRSSL